MKVFDFPQRSQEWFACRQGLATASCFAAILARGRAGDEAVIRRDYRLRLMIERLTGKRIEGYTSAAMLQGIEREPLARAAYESKTGEWVKDIGFVAHDVIEAGCSPDGLIGDDGCIEIKSPELAAHLDYLRLPSEPAKYTAQIQGQMWLCEREYCDFVSFNPDFPPRLQLIIRRVYRDEKYITGLALAVELFMAEVREAVAALESLEA